MADTVLKATHGSPDHPLRIGPLELPCYVLEDQRRVLAQRGMIASLGMSIGSGGGAGADRLASFVAGKAVEPFISKGLAAMIANPIKFRLPRGGVAYGYEATILADICDAVLAARKQGVLQKQQQHIAERCEILVRGFARVGIIALVDEATGYQVDRDREELNRILAAYISEELLDWTKRFPDEFYREMFRLLGWNYQKLSAKRPGYAGKLTKVLVYKQLPPGVLEELELKNPSTKGQRRHKHHQLLTEDIGNPHLANQIVKVTVLMKAARTWAGFKAMFARAFPAPGTQMQLDLDPDEDEGAD